MAMLIPNVGELRLLNELLDGGLARENWTLNLFKSNTTPAETDTVATYTKVTSSDWPGYAATTLTRTVGASTWNTPANGSPTNSWSAEASVAESAYGSAAITYTNNHGSNVVTVYGYIIEGATSGALIAAETFGTPRTLNPNDQCQFTPRFGLS
jgi:hypothetical protein